MLHRPNPLPPLGKAGPGGGVGRCRFETVKTCQLLVFII